MSPARLASRFRFRFLLAVTGFAGLGLTALAAARWIPLGRPADAETTYLLGQLTGLHAILLQEFFLLPVMTGVLGLAALSGAGRDPGFPRLVRAAWYLLVVGGLLVTGAALTGRVDADWVAALGQPGHRLSPLFLTGLLFGFLSLQGMAINLVVSLRNRKDSGTLLAWSLVLSGWLVMIAIPPKICALVLGWTDQAFSLGLLDGTAGGSPTLLAWLTVISVTPLRYAVVLPAVGVIATLFEVESRRSPAGIRRMRAALAALAVLSVWAVDTGGIADGAASWLPLAGTFLQVVMVLPLFAVLSTLVLAAPRNREDWNAGRIYAGAALALLILFTPFEILLSGGVPGEAYGASWMRPVVFHLSVAGVGLCGFLGALFGFGSTRMGFRFAARPARPVAFLVVFGLAATFGPLMVLGQHAVPFALRLEDPGWLVLQTLASAGLSLLALGLLSTLALARRRA